MTALRWYFSFLKKYRIQFGFAMFLVTINAVLTIVNPKVSQIMIDDVIKGEHYELLWTLIFVFIGTTFVRAIARYVYLYIFEDTSQNLLYSMRDFVYRKLVAEDFNFFNKNRTGDLMSRQTGDMDAIRHFTAYVVYQVYENALLLIVAIVMIITVDIRLALCMICVLPLTLLTTLKQLRAIKPAFQRIRDRFASLNTFVQENVSGNRVVKAFAKEDYEIQKFNQENDAYRDTQLEATAMWKKYIPIFEFLSSSLTIILYLVGGIMTVKGSMSLGNLVQVSGYLWMLNQPLRMAGWLANDYQRFITSIEKIYATISVEPDIKEPEQPVTTPLKGEVEFRHVNYQLDGVSILNDVSFHAGAGETIGIIGATGTGKSTLMNLLCRFYDVSGGEVRIDGTDVRQYDLCTLRGGIGMAMQDVFLFSDTIEKNIAYGKPDCSHEEVERAAKIANAHDFILETPDGYDTIVGERGMGLSGGQKQRISLARALLRNPAIVVLDDTTSAVDMETETRIQQALKSIGQGGQQQTVFIIAHRISSVKDADQILVLDEGRIVESGTHAALMEQQGYYYTVFTHQYGEFSKIQPELEKRREAYGNGKK